MAEPNVRQLQVLGKLVPSGGGAGLPSVTAEDNGKFLGVVNGAWVAERLPTYTESYSVTPGATEQTLPTAQKLMLADVTIDPIPYAEVSNTSGGLTVTIGNEE